MLRELKYDFDVNDSIDEVINFLVDLRNRGFKYVKGSFKSSVSMEIIHEQVQELRNKGYTNEEILDSVLCLES